MFDITGRARFTAALAATLLMFGCGGAMARSSAAGAMPGPGQASVTVASNGNIALPQEQLVVEGSLRLEVDDVTKTTAAARDQVATMGGRVISEQIGGAARSWTGSLKVRIPPDKVAPFIDWLEHHGKITNKQLQATDVGRTLFDQKIALDNLEHTMARLRKLLDHEQLATKEILDIEKEMTRIRLDIERIKGERRWLQDRVAFATLDIAVVRREGVILGPKAKFYPGLRLSSLILLDRDGRKRSRFGVGGVIHTVPRATIEVDVYGEVGDEKRAVVATAGGAAYSDFLGRGRRAFLNPYLGMRLGYGYLGASTFVIAADAGVEIFKHKYLLVDVNVRAVTFIGDDGADLAIVAGGGIVVPF